MIVDKTNDLIAMAELIKVANEEFDGHFSLLKFTTYWRCSLGTNNLNRVGIQKVSVGITMAEAIWDCLDTRAQIFGRRE